MIIYLERFAQTPHGVFGRLRMEEFDCYTIERPWLDNRKYESCIPTGVYPLRATTFHRGNYDTFEVCDVPDRSRILIHRGNTMEHVIGCIAIGESLGWINSRWAVTHSRAAWRRFWQLAKQHSKGEINISWWEE